MTSSTHSIHFTNYHIKITILMTPLLVRTQHSFAQHHYSVPALPSADSHLVTTGSPRSLLVTNQLTGLHRYGHALPRESTLESTVCIRTSLYAVGLAFA